MKKRRLWWLLVPGIIAALVIAFFLGPRPDSSPDIRPVDISADATTYLADSEANYPDIVPGTEKTILWAGTPGDQTEVAVIFLHGFSGSRQAMVPASDQLAQQLKANLFYTRYSGHGRGADPLGDATLQDWINDTVEAIAVGRSIGEFVVVVAVSTAAPLVAWLDTNGVTSDAVIMVSPNFGPADEAAELLLLPWGSLIARLVIGEYNEFDAVSALHARYSTPRFPSSALVTMMAAVDLGRKTDLESISTPLLCLYSSRDEVVSLDRMREAFDRIGSPVKEFREIRAATGHVLAGDAHSPESTVEFVLAALEFVERVR